MRKKGKLLLVLALAVLVVTSCTTEKPAESRLDAILERGKMICATSADFPPMEYINEDGTFAGFDIDFINEVGRRMGVTVEMWDMPFDSLVQSLADGKVDCVIAGMGPSEERDKQVDFSISYKERVYAVMSAIDSDVVVNEFDDIANYRLGTLSGGVQVELFRERWLETGMMPEENLLFYDRTDSGILDLVAGRLDLWWSQDVVVQDWITREPVKAAFIVPGEIIGGATVISLPEGDAVVKAKFDEIINEMIEDGYRDRLLDTWGIPH